MKLDDYGDSFSMALKNYIEKVHNHEISAKEAAKLAKQFSIADAIKLSDAVENNDQRVIRNILLDKIGIEEGYGMTPSAPTPSTTVQNKMKRQTSTQKNPAVQSQRNIQPTGQGARLNVPNQQAQNTMTVQQNTQVANANSAKADANRRDIENLKKMAGVR
mgnify:CR=1 FL=1|jgi:hypothetical protein|tara:strand:+ start:4011 stop:4493 length:483 start_codon:yes stop_codon:yes gene_type:complete